MQPTEPTQTEALLAHMERQTKALEKINGTMNFFLAVFLVSVVLWLIFTIA